VREESNRFIFDVMMEEGREENSRIALAAMLGAVPHFDLACLGISIHGLGALTFEAIACLASADVVYCYPPTAHHYELLKRINKNLINLHDTLYSRGSEFNPAYDAIIKEVMNSVRSGSKVAYATQGSPAFHCGTAASLHRIAKQEGFSSILISGISSFELLSAELVADYDINSIQICSIVQLAAGLIEITSRTPCLLFDLGRYALPAIREDASNLNRPKIVALTGLLCTIYPADHEIILMYVRSNGVCSQSKTTLEGLEEALMAFGAAPTLFLPAK
jgi:precorrin-6B methylase 1